MAVALRLHSLVRMLHWARGIVAGLMVVVAGMVAWMWAVDRFFVGLILLFMLAPLGSLFLVLHRLASSWLVRAVNMGTTRAAQAQGPRPFSDRPQNGMRRSPSGPVDVPWRDADRDEKEERRSPGAIDR